MMLQILEPEEIQPQKAKAKSTIKLLTREIKLKKTSVCLSKKEMCVSWSFPDIVIV